MKTNLIDEMIIALSKLDNATNIRCVYESEPKLNKKNRETKQTFKDQFNEDESELKKTVTIENAIVFFDYYQLKQQLLQSKGEEQDEGSKRETWHETANSNNTIRKHKSTDALYLYVYYPKDAKVETKFLLNENTIDRSELINFLPKETDSEVETIKVGLIKIENIIRLEFADFIYERN